MVAGAHHPLHTQGDTHRVEQAEVLGDAKQLQKWSYRDKCWDRHYGHTGINAGTDIMVIQG